MFALQLGATWKCPNSGIRRLPETLMRFRDGLLRPWGPGSRDLEDFGPPMRGTRRAGRLDRRNLARGQRRGLEQRRSSALWQCRQRIRSRDMAVDARLAI